MDKKAAFKEFVKTKPELIDYVLKNNMTWQKFYEIYDLYGEDKTIWDKYTNVNNNSLNKLTNLVKNVDLDSIQNHIGTAQKALGFIQELTSKNSSNISKIATDIASSPRPINKFFED